MNKELKQRINDILHKIMSEQINDAEDEVYHTEVNEVFKQLNPKKGRPVGWRKKKIIVSDNLGLTFPQVDFGDKHY